MCKRPRVENDEGATLIGLLDMIDQLRFGIALEGMEFMTKIFGSRVPSKFRLGPLSNSISAMSG
jgi:hypothetical protein